MDFEVGGCARGGAREVGGIAEAVDGVWISNFLITKVK